MGAFNNVVLENENQRQKSLFDLSHEHSSTFAFGEIQPLNCQLLPIPSDITTSLKNLTRCFPLVAPCYGHIATKTFTSFIGFSDIFPKWREMFTNQDALMLDDNSQSEYISAWSKSAVTSLPTINQLTICIALLRNCTFIRYVRTTGLHQRTARWNMANASVNDLSAMLGLNPRSAFTLISDSIHAVSSVSDKRYFAPSEADFNVFYTDGSGDSRRDLMVTIKLSQSGRRLFKVLQGLGYKISFRESTQPFSILPMLAFYKAYWLQFGLVQYQSWNQTACYNLIERFSHSGNDAARFIYGNEIVDPSSGTTAQKRQYKYNWDKWKCFLSFLEELEDCFYTDVNTLESMALPPEDWAINPNQAVSNPFSALNYFQGAISHSLQENPFKYGAEFRQSLAETSTVLNMLDDVWLKELYKYTMKETQLAGDVEKALVERGLKSYIDECSTHFIGGTSSVMTITEVTSTSDTANIDTDSGKVVGDPAGRGVNYDENNEFHFSNKEPGYIISFGCIVPLSNTIQRVDSTHECVTPTEFYLPAADGLGFSAVSVDKVGYVDSVEHIEPEGSPVENSVFGLAPRYWEFKTKKNTINGAFRLCNEMDSVLPYNLDSLIIRNPLVVRDLQANGSFLTNDVVGGQTFSDDIGAFVDDYSIPDAGETWKKTMKSAYFGHYDRIFNQLAERIDDRYLQNVDNYAYRDSFIVHCIVEFKMNAAMLPISLGYGTIEDNDPRNKKTTKVKR